MTRNDHQLLHGSERLTVSCHRHPDRLDVELEGSPPVSLGALAEGRHALSIQVGDRVVTGAVAVLQDRVLVSYDGRTWALFRAEALSKDGDAEGEGGGGVPRVLEAPMTGRVLEVRCRTGDLVPTGATLIVIEAMKMEHRLTAGAHARVVEVLAEAGQAVDIGQPLVRLAPAEDAKGGP